MSVYSYTENTLCRIEVRLQPGLPRIEVLGSGSRAIKDASVKAKLLLQQQGYKFPRNKKIYICLDPFLKAAKGLDLAIYIAMKEALENQSHSSFVYGSLSFDGSTASDLKEEHVLGLIPNHMRYLVGQKNFNVFSKPEWKYKRQSKFLWSPKLSPLLFALVKEKQSILLLYSKAKNVDEVLASLSQQHLVLHNEQAKVLSDIHVKRATKSPEKKSVIASMKACPCGRPEEKKLCRKPKKHCESYVRAAKYSFLEQFSFIFLVEGFGFSEEEPHFPATPYELLGGLTLPSSLNPSEQKSFGEILRWLPREVQEDASMKLFEAYRYHHLLLPS